MKRIFPTFRRIIRKEMKLQFVTSMDEVLKIALEREMVALPLAATYASGGVGARNSEERISV